MLDLQAAVRNAELKLELIERKEKLESEGKLLDAEVRKLKVIAEYEQRDVENMKMPSLQGLLLRIAGKKQELLEREQTEARKAQENYEYALLRQESVKDKLSRCIQQLAELGACEKELRELVSFPEDSVLSMLIRCNNDTILLKQQIDDALGVVRKVLRLGEFRGGTQSTAALAGTDDRLLSAERKAQSMLTQLKIDLGQYVLTLANFGMTLDMDDLQRVQDDYLTDIYTEALITSRVDKVSVILRQLGFQIDAIQPIIAQLASEQNKKYLRTLLNAARSK